MEIKKVKIIKYQNKESKTLYDTVIQEKVYDLYVNEKLIYRFNTFDKDLKYLVVGYLFYKGIISDIKDIQKMQIDKDVINVKVNKSLDLSFENKPMEIDSLKIINLMENFENSNELFKLTGGVHSAAIANENEILFKTDDISRHNCIDKVIGYWLENLKSKNNLVLLLTGRVNEKIITKIIKCPISMIISRSAPTTLAIEIAKSHKISLIGFARGENYNKYC